MQQQRSSIKKTSSLLRPPRWLPFHTKSSLPATVKMLSTRFLQAARSAATVLKNQSVRTMGTAKSFVRSVHVEKFNTLIFFARVAPGGNYWQPARSFSSLAAQFFVHMKHLDSPDNNETTFFDFTEENYERANRYVG